MSGTHLFLCAGHQPYDRDDRLPNQSLLPNEQDRCLSGFFLSLFALLALSVTQPVSVAVEKKASCRPAQNGEGQPSEETKGDAGGMEFNPLGCQPHHNQGKKRMKFRIAKLHSQMDDHKPILRANIYIILIKHNVMKGSQMDYCGKIIFLLK